MKTLSDRFTDLSDRSKHLEEVLGAARDRDLEVLTARRTALLDAITRGGAKLDDAGEDVVDKLKGPWRDARKAVEHTFSAARQEADEHRAHKGLAKAERRADHAERDAAAAVALAVLVLDRTGYAVAEAVLARADADDLLSSAEAAAAEAADAATAPA